MRIVRRASGQDRRKGADKVLLSPLWEGAGLVVLVLWFRDGR